MADSINNRHAHAQIHEFLIQEKQAGRITSFKIVSEEEGMKVRVIIGKKLHRLKIKTMKSFETFKQLLEDLIAAQNKTQKPDPHNATQ